jgi:hypothetical protein
MFVLLAELHLKENKDLVVDLIMNKGKKLKRGITEFDRDFDNLRPYK